MEGREIKMRKWKCEMQNESESVIGMGGCCVH
jgi:hypothetical protein